MLNFLDPVCTGLDFRIGPHLDVDGDGTKVSQKSVRPETIFMAIAQEYFRPIRAHGVPLPFGRTSVCRSSHAAETAHARHSPFRNRCLHLLPTLIRACYAVATADPSPKPRVWHF